MKSIIMKKINKIPWLREFELVVIVLILSTTATLLQYGFRKFVSLMFVLSTFFFRSFILGMFPQKYLALICGEKAFAFIFIGSH